MVLNQIFLKCRKCLLTKDYLQQYKSVAPFDNLLITSFLATLQWAVIPQSSQTHYNNDSLLYPPYHLFATCKHSFLLTR